MTVSAVTVDALRLSVTKAERDFATASPRLRAHARLVLQMARAALEDALRENKQ